MTSKISVDIQELLMVLVDIKHLYSQLLNKYFIVSDKFVLGIPKIRPKYKKIPSLRDQVQAVLKIRRVIKRSLIKEKKICKYYMTLGNNKKDIYKLNSYYNVIENSLKFRTKKQLKSLFASSIKRIKNIKNKMDSLPKTYNKLINIKSPRIMEDVKTRLGSK